MVSELNFRGTSVKFQPAAQESRYKQIIRILVMKMRTYSISSTSEHRSGGPFRDVLFLRSQTTSSFLVESGHEQRLMMLKSDLLFHKMHRNMGQSQ